jgi:hypothetical protein
MRQPNGTNGTPSTGVENNNAAASMDSNSKSGQVHPF